MGIVGIPALRPDRPAQPGADRVDLGLSERPDRARRVGRRCSRPRPQELESLRRVDGHDLVCPVTSPEGVCPTRARSLRRCIRRGGLLDVDDFCGEGSQSCGSTPGGTRETTSARSPATWRENSYRGKKLATTERLGRRRRRRLLAPAARGRRAGPRRGRTSPARPRVPARRAERGRRPDVPTIP